MARAPRPVPVTLDDNAIDALAPEQVVWSAGFSGVGASVLDPRFAAPRVGAGVSYNQAAGSLNILTGTTPNSEFLARSINSFAGSMRLRYSIVASQRIANSNFAVLLADLIAEGAAYTIINSTTVDVNAPAHGLDTTMITQSCLLGGISGAAGVPGRFAIASIPNADTLRFTVAGWPASGTGTLTVFGRNYVRNLLTGTTATNVAVDAQRNGWATGDTNVTTLTTASPGLLLAAELTGRDVFFFDSLRASTATPNFRSLGSRYENIPDATTPLHVFLWSFNGTGAPATSTTFTLSHCAIEAFKNTSVYIQGARANGAVNPIPVAQQGSLTIATLPALAAGANVIGSIATAGTPAAPTAVPINSVASTNGQLIITGTAGVQYLYATNTGAGAAYVKLYNKATAPTVGTDVPVMMIPVPAAAGGVPGPAQIVPGFNGIRFPLGLGLAITGGAADSDTTAVLASQVKVMISRTA